ncbi:MAG: hypothetical protein H6713_36415 [Myxococcales bacterium]|nr:hypothetical protein [Myxococcales bacterium]
MAIGSAHACALRADGRVTCWGAQRLRAARRRRADRGEADGRRPGSRTRSRSRSA